MGLCLERATREAGPPTPALVQAGSSPRSCVSPASTPLLRQKPRPSSKPKVSHLRDKTCPLWWKPRPWPNPHPTPRHVLAIPLP